MCVFKIIKVGDEPWLMKKNYEERGWVFLRFYFLSSLLPFLSSSPLSLDSSLLSVDEFTVLVVDLKIGMLKLNDTKLLVLNTFFVS